MTNREKVARWLCSNADDWWDAPEGEKGWEGKSFYLAQADELLALLGEAPVGEPVESPWKLWDGWGPHTDGLMRVSRIGPSIGGLEAFYNTNKADIQGTREDLELVVNAVNAYLHPGSQDDG
jgi:hypothetical protein